MQFTEEKNIPGMLLMIDFEKAFDSVSWSFIDNILEFFNFGKNIRSWIKTLHTDITSAITQGGNLSKFFKIQRGCRQGDPIAPYIFILCVEILADRLRNNRNLKGIKLDNEVILVSQYADDTSLVLDGTEKSLQEAISELNMFASISGLKINTNKTQVVWIGSKKYSDDTFLPELNLQWGANKFTVLGIDFCVDLHQIPKTNFDKKLIKLKSVINDWKKRNLTPVGRIHVIKSLIISQFNHLFIALPNPSDNFIKNLNTLLFNFLWNGKTDKVKRDVIIQDYMNGGLKMVDLCSYVDALKLSWIRRLYKTTGKWQYILKASSCINLELISHCGKEYIETCSKTFKNKFWKDVFIAWNRLNHTEFSTKTKKESILKAPLWYNPGICVGNNTLKHTNWCSVGVCTINDLVKSVDDLTFYTFQEFINLYQIETNFLVYQGLIVATRQYLNKNKINTATQRLTRPSLPMIPLSLEIFLKNIKGSRDFYLRLISKKLLTPPTGKKKWNKIFNREDIDWLIIYRSPFAVTNSSKLQWFQFRVNHHILTTNSFLFKSGLVVSPRCTFCNAENESIIHCLWECREVQQLLKSFDTLLKILRIPFSLSKETFLFGINLNTLLNRIDNEIRTLMKFYIYKSRCLSKVLHVNMLVNAITDHFTIQKYVSVKKGPTFEAEFREGWNKWATLLTL